MEDLMRSIGEESHAASVTPKTHPEFTSHLQNLGTLYSWKYGRTGDEQDLNKTIDYFGLAATATSEESPYYPVRFKSHAVWLNKRFERNGNIEDANMAVTSAEHAVGCGSQHPEYPVFLGVLGTCLGRRFASEGSMGDLDRGVEVARQTLEYSACDHPHASAFSNNLGLLLQQRFERLGNMQDLEEAICHGYKAVNATTPVAELYHSSFLYNLSTWLGLRFRGTGSEDDMNAAVEFARRAVEKKEASDLEFPSFVNNLANQLGRRAEHTASIDGLEEAVQTAARAVQATAERNHAQRAEHLTNWSAWLGRLSEETGDIEQLEKAVKGASDAVEVTPAGHPTLAGHLQNLSGWQLRLFERSQSSKEYIDSAVESASRSVALTPKAHIELHSRLRNLSTCLGLRYRRSNNPVDLDRAIEAARKSAKLCSENKSGLSLAQTVLTTMLMRRFERNGSLQDLEEACAASAQAVEVPSQGGKHRINSLHEHACCLSLRGRATGSIADFNQAIDVVEEALRSSSPKRPNHATLLTSLANFLHSRFQMSDSMEDLERAQDIAGEVSNLMPSDHPERLTNLTGLGAILSEAYERAGQLDNLEKSIDWAVQSVEATPIDDVRRVTRMVGLAKSILKRFEIVGSFNDLERACTLSEQALECAVNHFNGQIGAINVLAICQGRLFERTGALEYLDRAVELFTRLLGLLPTGHADTAGTYHNLAVWLGRRHERRFSDRRRGRDTYDTEKNEDLDRGIEACEKALELLQTKYAEKSQFLNTHGNLLGYRFKRDQALQDIDKAVQSAEAAVQATPKNHSLRVNRFNNLGDKLGMRLSYRWTLEDEDRQLSAYVSGWSCSTGAPSVRVRSAQEAANIHARRKNWRDASDLLTEAVLLLPVVNTRELEYADMENFLARLSGLASTAAATSLNAGKDPVEVLRILELGRGVIAGLVMDLRIDTSHLRETHPELAAEFHSLQAKLDAPTVRSDVQQYRNWKSQEDSQRHVRDSFDKLVRQIRDLPGFQNFLQPPSEQELVAAATPDPIVIINATSYRCDALIVDRKGSRLLTLPLLTISEIEKRVAALASLETLRAEIDSILEWLWVSVCSPCLNELGFKGAISEGEEWPRIWWIPTDLLTQLPLHAAGLHQTAPEENVMDRVMSSYASSIRSLLHTRRRAASCAKSALCISMPTTPGLFNDGLLPYADDETDLVHKMLPSLGLAPIPSLRRKQDVLSELPKCKIFHFAGHGSVNKTNPSESCLLLEDWEKDPLTVADLRRSRLQENPPFLAYLSACSTGASRVRQLSDESVHLISAFQLAGFRHVVGTLWEVSDIHCVQVAKILYETLALEGATDTAMCRGLHLALRTLRNEGRSIIADPRDAKVKKAGKVQKPGSCSKVSNLMNYHWVPYVHYGV